MFGGNAESTPVTSFSLDLEHQRKEAVNEFFDGYVQGSKILTGGEYLNLFQIGANAGFSDAELKTYLKEHNIKVKSALPSTELSPSMSYDTPDNGKQFPNRKQ